jgi:hypothetical protein
MIATAETLMTRDEHFAYMRDAGFRWVRTDDVVINQDDAIAAVSALDERIACLSLYNDAATDSIRIRDRIAAEIQRAKENS